MRITLTVTGGPHLGRAFNFAEHDTFLVGRSKKATFRLPGKDKYFSRVHFMIELNPPLCRVHDMGARNQTYVNGERVESRDLRDGDEIRAGKTILKVRIETSPEQVSTVDDPQRGVALADDQPQPASPHPAPTAAPPELAPGYERIKELGIGAMGVVYLARRRGEEGLVAVKMITPVVAPKRQYVERFLREADILRQLDHSHIVRFLELGEHAGRLYFVMEYVPGEDAKELLKKHGPLPVQPAVRLICQALLGLEYAHAKGFVHRDVKPANLLIGGEPGRRTVKVADFGLARVYQASRLSGLTLQGDLGGTIEYLAPEQIAHYRDVSPAADQYAVAATLYHLLSGRFVYDLPPRVAAQLAMILRDKPVPLRKRRADLPADLCAVIHKALAREPEDRFPDAAAFRLALQPFGR
jgi:serine/threonine-protein kinase